MRPTAHFVLEHQMDVMTGHPALEIFGGRNPLSLHTFDQAAFDELHRLHGAIGLFRQHRYEVRQLALMVGQGALAEIGEYQRGAGRDRGNQQEAANDE